MKKLYAGFATCFGSISAAFAYIDAFPKYNNIFMVLIGVFFGFLLSVLIPGKDKPEPMSDRTKAFALMVTMFILPPLLLIGAIASIAALGLMTGGLLAGMLGWGFSGIVIAYIVAGCVAESHNSTGVSGEENGPNDTSDQKPS